MYDMSSARGGGGCMEKTSLYYLTVRVVQDLV